MRLFEIDIEINWSWWVVIGIVCTKGILAFGFSGLIISLLAVTLIGVIILGHELAHALMARSFGYKTQKISLHFLGGVAMINIRNATPAQLFWIALAGPAFNLVLFAITSFLIKTGVFASFAMLTLAAERFALFNLLIGLFNLLPAWPMDGGRILRALMLGYKPRVVMDVSHILSGACIILFVILGVIGLNPILLLLAGILSWFVWLERMNKRMMK